MQVAGTIVLNSPLTITGNVVLLGPGADALTILGPTSARAITVAAGANVTLEGVTVSGDGIQNLGSLTLTDDALSANNNSFMAGDGGGALENDGTAIISASTLAGNVSTGNGGAVLNNGTLIVTESTLADNITYGGGGAIYNAGTLTVLDSTVYGNDANANGGGIANAGQATLLSSIVAGNTVGEVGPDVFGTFASEGNNLVGASDGSSGWLGSDQTGTLAQRLDPRLGGLQNNGGHTLTLLPLPGSPAS